MRSELVYSANDKIQNRFLLASVVIRAVRKLHVVSTRTEDTANRVLSEVSDGRYIEVEMPALKPIPPIEPLLVAPAA